MLTTTGPVDGGAREGGATATMAADIQLRDLTETVAALRATLEAQAAEHAAAVQMAVQAAAEEIVQLRAACARLRFELEQLSTAKDIAVPWI